MNKRQINNVLVGIIVVFIFILAFLVIQPILISMIFGMIFAYVFHPAFRRINVRLKNKTASAVLLMLLLAFLLIVPIIYYTPTLIEQIFSLFEDIRQINIADFVVMIFSFIEPGSTAYSILANLNNVPGRMISALTEDLFASVLNFPHLLIQTFVFLFTFFFATKDSGKLQEYFKDISPFSKATERRFLKEFRAITNSVILGQVLIGVIQGLFVGIGLLLLGVENVITLTVITMIVSIIPIVGAWLVWGPIAIFMIINGDATNGIILALYGLLFVSNIDNILRPYLLSRSSKLPVYASLTGTIGGLYFLGILGLVLGPLIIAYALIIIDFYKEGRLDELYRETKSQSSVGSYDIK